MAPKLNVGLRVPAVHPTNVEALKAFVQRAEALGFHSIWVGDHVFYHLDVPQPLNLLTWIAALTTRVRLGTAVMLGAYLDPVTLARQAATLDCLSGGRLTLGLSIGGTEAEYRSLGVPMKQRVGRLMESADLIRRLWSEGDVAFEGRYFQVEHGNLRPKPAQKPGPPLYFGAFQEPMLRRIAARADGWIAAGGTIDSFISGVALVRRLVREDGRDPDSLGFAKLHGVSVHRSRAEALARAQRHWQAYYGPKYDVETSTIVGTPAECAAKLAAFTAVDAPEVTLALEPSSLDLDQLELLFETTRGLA